MLSDFTVPPQVFIDPMTDVLKWDEFLDCVCIVVDDNAIGGADFDFDAPPSSQMNYQKSPHEWPRFLGVI